MALSVLAKKNGSQTGSWFSVQVPQEDFDLADILQCGQCFRFIRQADGSFAGVAQGRFLRVYQDGDRLYLENTDPETFARVWAPYFDLSTDYAAIKRFLSADPVLRRACQTVGGIRILRQDGWEATCSFILSQNNNIPRIQGIIDRLCRLFGEPADGPPGSYCFPTAERLAQCSPEDLAPLRAGFRVRYLLDAARKFASQEIRTSRLYHAPYPEARAELMQICGVGPKVADCALLYGFARTEAFPADVWIKRALAEWYPDGFPDWAKVFGGYAQQYLFHYIRTGGQ
ncbi:MAG TPA: DNA-3-methyladenine glycosylase 2 family protein [Firmicutes bacterium]|nr:DNA-3-methyladenine glycosylase 2 family protein [Bacillota bacterium]